MTQTETRTELPTDVQPQLYRLRTPLMKHGRMDTVLATTDTMQVRMKSYAQGGENALHAHSREDHTFIVLAGHARFWGQGDVEMGVFGRNEAVMLPRGCFYRFESCGDEPLVMSAEAVSHIRSQSWAGKLHRHHRAHGMRKAARVNGLLPGKRY